MSIYITKMTREHIPQVAEIEKQSFSMPWSAEAFEESFQYEHALFFVAVDGETQRILGYIGIYKVFGEGDITNIAVAPDYRGNGVATMLMQEAKRQSADAGIETLMLEVRQSNEAAINLYKKMGFESIGIRRRFYERPTEDAIVMSLQLLPL